MTESVLDAMKAVEIARKYALRSTSALYWKDVVEVKQNVATHNWEVTYEASPSIISPYNKYFIEIDSKNSKIINAKKLE